MISNVSIKIRAQYQLIPANPNPNSTLILGFHGYAETSREQMKRLQALNLPESVVYCAPQGYSRFYTKSGNVVSSWMTKAFREEAIEDLISYIDTLIEELHKKHACKTKPIVFGFSQGAALAYRYALLGKYKCEAVVAIGSDIPPGIIPLLSSLPATLICQGREDERIPAKVFSQSISMLEKANVEFDSLEYSGGHLPTDKCLEKIGEFVSAKLR